MPRSRCCSGCTTRRAARVARPRPRDVREPVARAELPRDAPIRALLIAAPVVSGSVHRSTRSGAIDLRQLRTTVSIVEGVADFDPFDAASTVAHLTLRPDVTQRRHVARGNRCALTPEGSGGRPNRTRRDDRSRKSARMERTASSASSAETAGLNHATGAALLHPRGLPAEASAKAGSSATIRPPRDETGARTGLEDCQ